VGCRAFLQWRTEQRSFDRLGAYATQRATLSAPGLDARRYRSAALSAALLPVLEVHPMIGRGFGPDDERAGAAPVVLLGEELWTREFGRNRDVVGLTVRVMLLLGLAMGALLLAAVNAADLLLLRAIRRIPELALRATLGAGRARLAQHMIAEAIVPGAPPVPPSPARRRKPFRARRHARGRRRSGRG